MVKQDLRTWQNYSYAVSPKMSATKPQATRLEPITDAEGLRRAKENGSVHVHGHTLYVNGTQSAQDWGDNIKHIPNWQTINKIKNVATPLLNAAGVEIPPIPDVPADWGNMRESAKYKAAEEALKAHPEITHVVGHSQGGSVALELQKAYPELKTRTYGTPVFDPLGLDAFTKGYGNIERYANEGDPVAMFDASAQRTQQDPGDNGGIAGFFNHNYKGVASQHGPGASDFIRPSGATVENI